MGSRVSEDEKPQNILNRTDVSNFHGMLLEPGWGDEAYKKVGVGELELFLLRTSYDPAAYESVCAIKEGSEIVSSFAPIDRSKFLNVMTRSKTSCKKTMT